MKTRLIGLSVIAGSALFLSACQSTGIATRIQEKSVVFAKLPPEVQGDIQQGSIAPGYTADMVYMALGKPNQVRVKDTSQGKVGAWIYRNFYPGGYEAKDPEHAEPPPPATSAFTRPGTADYGFAKTDERQTSLYPQSRMGKGVRLEIANAGTFSTRSAWMNPLELPDMDSASLCVVFYQGHVVQIFMGQD